MPVWYSEWRESWLQGNAWRENWQNILNTFINIVDFLIFVDKSWFKVTNYLFIFSFMCIFKPGLAVNECYEYSKLTKNFIDSSA